MARKIDPETCVGCGTCKNDCPVDAIIEEGGKCVIKADDCVDCGACEANCPVSAITGE